MTLDKLAGFGCMNPLVYIVILNWNKPEETVRCLAALAELNYDNYRVIVIENGSHDRSIEIIKTAPYDIELLVQDRNLGFAGGCNVGMRLAIQRGAQYVWLLNNDAQVEMNTLNQLVATMERDRQVALCSPVIRHIDGTLEDAGGYFDPVAASYHVTSDIAQAQQWQAEHPQQFTLFGTALLIRCAALEIVGLFDEAFFAYWEDTDLSIRVNQSGWRNVTVFDADVFHVKPSSPQHLPHFNYYMIRNEMYLWRKHLFGVARYKHMIWVVRRALRKVQQHQHDRQQVNALLAGLWDGLWGKTGAYHADNKMPQPWLFLIHKLRIFLGYSQSSIK